jgi:hypothetical protein
MLHGFDTNHLQQLQDTMNLQTKSLLCRGTGLERVQTEARILYGTALEGISGKK